ncbi:hypothetical protein RB653_006964 [Dictyostelium firmibasis]|uniref:FZ domain-containing protein n=1 Tax=Dictyostelium firmibasis TaxID=79012 RepID=A0AAN7TVP1_9MYCE
MSLNFINFLLLILLIGVVKGVIYPIKVDIGDTKLCFLKGIYNVDFQGHYFRFENENHPKKYLIPNETAGYFQVSPFAKKDGFFLDEFIYATIYGTNSYQYEKHSKIDCATYLATYMCSYTFIKSGVNPPCNQICEPIINCSNNFTYKINGGEISIIPSLQNCIDQGTSDECSAINMKGLLYNWEHIEKPRGIEKYPGGVLRGTLLSFGALIGLLFVIGSLGIIMKYQN